MDFNLLKMFTGTTIHATAPVQILRRDEYYSVAAAGAAASILS